MIRDRKTETDRAKDTYKDTEHTQKQRHRERMGFLKQEKHPYETENHKIVADP